MIDKNVCENHNDIIYICTELKTELLEYFKNSSMVDIGIILAYLEVIEDRVKQANYQARKMGNRLRKYRKLIERLGFRRVDKNGL